MFITMECDYAIRIIRALAAGEKLSASEICAAENIPSQYAYKILKKLERAGFVEVIRGCDGGYKLVKPLSEFSIFDIVSATGKNLFINACLNPENSCANNSDGDAPCVVHHELVRIQDILIGELSKKSMLELISSTT